VLAVTILNSLFLILQDFCLVNHSALALFDSEAPVQHKLNVAHFAVITGTFALILVGWGSIGISWKSRRVTVYRTSICGFFAASAVLVGLEVFRPGAREGAACLGMALRTAFALLMEFLHSEPDRATQLETGEAASGNGGGIGADEDLEGGNAGTTSQA
jgi:hypothetical protein